MLLNPKRFLLCETLNTFFDIFNLAFVVNYTKLRIIFYEIAQKN